MILSFDKDFEKIELNLSNYAMKQGESQVEFEINGGKVYAKIQMK